MHHSTGVACVTLLLTFGCLSLSEARQSDGRAAVSSTQPPAQHAIHKALTESSPARVQILLDRGADIESRNDRGATPLITASGRGNLPLVVLLLEQGARIDAADRDGNTALHEASFQSHPSCVDALLAANAPTTAHNAFGFSPLHQAVRRFWETGGESRTDRLTRQAQVINELLRHGADPDNRDDAGRTPAALAAENNNGSLRQLFSLYPASRPLTVTGTTQSPLGHAAPSHSEREDQATAAPPADNLPETHVAGTLNPTHSQPADLHQNQPAPPPSQADSMQKGRTPEEPAISPPPSTPVASPLHTQRVPVPEPSITSPAPMAQNQEAGAASSIDRQPPVSTSTGERPVDSPPLPVGSPPSTLQSREMAIAAPKSPAPTPIPSDQSWRPARIPPRATLPSPPVTNPAEDSTPAALTEQPGRHGPGAFSAESTSHRTAQVGVAAFTEPEPGQHPPAPSAQATAQTSDPASTPTPPRPGSIEKTSPDPAARQSPWIAQSLGFGLGLGWTHNLGPRRVESVSVVNRVVRIDEEQNDLVRAMPELHLWIDRWDEQRWSWGPFLTVAPGARVIDAVGGGLMLGYRPHRDDRYSFNLGIGGTLDLDARVLGDGLVANEPLPPRETSARTKQTTAAGLLILFSVGWDLSAARQAPETNLK